MKPHALYLTLLASTLLPSVAQAQCSTAPQWIGSWASSQQTPETNNALAPEQIRHAVLRQVVHLSLGGPGLRLHLSNAFGRQSLHLRSVHVAQPDPAHPGAILAGTDLAATFAGNPDVTIPGGAEYLSDPIAFKVAPLADLAVTLEYDEAPNGQTGHPGSRATSYLAHDTTPDAVTLPNATKVEHWYQLSGVDVPAGGDSFAIVALGDSITDGHGATTNGNDRWPDLLSSRLQMKDGVKNIGVLNEGIGGNRLLADGLGPNALSRLNRDVLAQPGARAVFLLEGVNDLGGATRTTELSAAEHARLVASIEIAYAQIVAQAHGRGLTVYGGTITPFTGSDYYHPSAAVEADRQQINAWVRARGHFDGVIDFDHAIADPKQPERLLPAYDSGDHLHPSPAGYRAMAEAVPTSLLRTLGPCVKR